ncbi:MAG: DUF6152 family protein [Gammaproteobacteria bacterium]|nr:DUF6152 family protein [Gammaproteobacteria bacterium]
MKKIDPRATLRSIACLSLKVLLLTGAHLAAHPIAYAHHSNSAFDLGNIFVLEGTVAQFDWTNPHVYLVIEEDNGTEWLIETDAVAVMTRSGWTRDSFVAGDLVSARINRDRDLTKAHGLLLSIQSPDGEQLVSINRFRDRMNYDANAITTDLSGVWQGDQSLSRAFSARMNEHPLTERGQAGKEAYDGSVDPGADCVAWPTPWLVASGLYLKEITLSEDVVVMKGEFYNAERTIHMGLREHPDDIERTVQGHSIGWWDGDTLVVDTRFFADHRSPISNIGIPSGAMKHVTERYTLDDDGRRVSIEIFLEDPEYLAEPFTANLALHYSPHLELIGIECDPEVATRFRR